MTRNVSGMVPGNYKVVVEKDPSAVRPGAATSEGDPADDPGMKSIAAETNAAISKAQRRKDKAAEKVYYESKKEVPAGGGPIDIDVKASSAV